MNSPLQIAVAGAGAIGTVVAHRLASTGQDVTIVARGRRAEQLRRDGLRVAGSPAMPARITDAMSLAAQDVLILAVKEQHLAGMLSEVGHAIGPETLVVPLVNGVPFWIMPGQHVPGCVVGAVVYIMSQLGEDGTALSSANERLILGLPAGGDNPTLDAFVALMNAGGIETRQATGIEGEIWSKMALNLATNPLSVVAGADLRTQFHDPHLSTIVRSILTEAVAVGQAIGVTSAMNVGQMMDLGRGLGPIRTSMLQDHQAGRPLELAGIAGRCLQIGRQHGVAMPATTAIVQLATFAGHATAIAGDPESR